MLAAITWAAPVPTVWCGSNGVPDDRLADAVAGAQIHVAYAVPADGADNFAVAASAIASDLAAVDGWWRREDPTRTPRFDLFAFAGCADGLGRLDLSSVRLPHGTAYFQPIDGRPERLRGDLSAAFSNSQKKYLVYYDAPVDVAYDCGQSQISATGGTTFSFVYLQAGGCTHDLGDGGGTAGYAAHELLHNLGAVPDQAPHVCFESAVCDWYWDIATQFPTGDPIDKLILDYGHDDYYGHSGSWFDVQDSLWLSHLDTPRYELVVALRGQGHGSVTSTLPGISCPNECTATWDAGTRVALYPDPGPGSRLAYWGGACTGRGDCNVTMDAVKAVSATFGPQRARLSVAVLGAGSVKSTPAAIACPRRCSALFPGGTVVRLKASSAGNGRFVHWAGACRGTHSCAIRLDDNASVRAVFRRR